MVMRAMHDAHNHMRGVHTPVRWPFHVHLSSHVCLGLVAITCPFLHPVRNMTTTELGAEALTMTGSTTDGSDDDEWRELLPPLLSAGAVNGQAGNGTGQIDDWPLRSYLKLGAIAASVPRARRHVRHVTREWGFAEFSEAIELAVSELATNALAASAGMGENPLIRVGLACDKARFLVLAWDGNPSPPIRRDADQDAEGGRGLLLVEALSERWDWHAHASLGGKVTWCEIAVTGPPESARRSR